MRDKQSNRLFKKHNTIIARLLLQSGIITPKFFNELYWAEFRRSKNKRWKQNGWYKFNYYTELHYSTIDYWGECDEHSVIKMAKDILFDKLITFDEVTLKYVYPEKWPKTTLAIIKSLRDGVQHNKLHRAKTKHLSINRSNISGKRRRTNKVLRLRKYHY